MAEIVHVLESKDVDLDTVFGEMSEGYKIAIKRIEPEWCSGHLGTHAISPDDAISMEWIKSRYGGKRIQIKILDPQGKYLGMRTENIPVEPKDGDGNTLVKGPDGRIMTSTEYEIERGGAKAPAFDIAGLAALMQTQAPAPAGGLDLTGLAALMQTLKPEPSDFGMKEMFAMMQTQAQQTQALLLNKISSLETAISGGGQPAANISGIKGTIGAIKELEELRTSLGVDDVQQQPSMYEKLAESFIDMQMQKETAKLDMQKQQQIETAKVPPLPGPEYTPALPQQQQQQAAPELSDIELAAMVKDRFEHMDEEQRKQALEIVFGGMADIEDTNIDEENETLTIDKETKSLLSEDDQQELDQLKQQELDTIEPDK